MTTTLQNFQVNLDLSDGTLESRSKKTQMAGFVALAFLNRFLGRDHGPGIQVTPKRKSQTPLFESDFPFLYKYVFSRCNKGPVIVDELVRDENGVKLMNTDYDDAWGVPSTSTLFETPPACREEALQRIADGTYNGNRFIWLDGNGLSNINTNSINLPFLAVTAEGPSHLEKELTREKFNDLCSDLIQRCKIPIKTSLKDTIYIINLRRLMMMLSPLEKKNEPD